MLRFAKTGSARGVASDTAAGHKDEDTYDRHAGNLYRQALFTLDDTELAKQVVSDVIVEECVWPAAAHRSQDAGRRLAVCAYRRCMELADGSAWTSGIPARRTGGCTGWAGLGGLTASERGALGLIVFGGVGYRQAGVELGISASGTAALLRTAVVKTAAAQPDSRPDVALEQVWR
jgi:hypothetical protein